MGRACLTCRSPGFTPSFSLNADPKVSTVKHCKKNTSKKNKFLDRYEGIRYKEPIKLLFSNSYLKNKIYKFYKSKIDQLIPFS